MTTETKSPQETMVEMLHSAAYRAQGITEAAQRVHAALEAMTPEQRAKWNVNEERLLEVAEYHVAAAAAFGVSKAVLFDEWRAFFEAGVLLPLKTLRNALRQLAARVEANAEPQPSEGVEEHDATVLVFKLPDGPKEIN